jgi:chaperonin cofactor prefoldin
MPDPFTVIGAASAVVALLETCTNALLFVTTYIREAQEVHETVTHLGAEIKQLQNELETIYEALENMTDVGPKRFRQALKEAVDDCECKLNTLAKILKRIHDSRTRLMAKFRYDINLPEIQRQIQRIDRCRQRFLICFTLINM